MKTLGVAVNPGREGRDWDGRDWDGIHHELNSVVRGLPNHIDLTMEVWYGLYLFSTGVKEAWKDAK